MLPGGYRRRFFAASKDEGPAKMIFDIHTHTPPFKDAVPADKLVMNNKWRPDRTVKATTCWADYFEAQKKTRRISCRVSKSFFKAFTASFQSDKKQEN